MQLTFAVTYAITVVFLKAARALLYTDPIGTFMHPTACP
jgi:hypothetical protein